MHCVVLMSLFTCADGDVENQSNWKGYFDIASYTPYFNVDTDVVVDRLVSSVYPMEGFFRKIDANPDMYVSLVPDWP
jgi:protein YIPF1/2